MEEGGICVHLSYDEFFFYLAQRMHKVWVLKCVPSTVFAVVRRCMGHHHDKRGGPCLNARIVLKVSNSLVFFSRLGSRYEGSLDGIIGGTLSIAGVET